jgi:glycosyltransferase involved in cell wall biosynthesis
VNVVTDSNIGGAGLVLINYLKAANRRDFDHTVIVPSGSMLLPRLNALGVRAVEMPGIAERSFAPKQTRAFLEEFRALRPDLVHTHASLSARVAARVYGKCGIIYTRHCAYELTRRQTSFPLRQIAGFVNNRLADRIIAVSPAARENLADTGANPARIVTLLNGVEPVRVLSDAEKRAARVKLGLREDEFVCAIIARLEDVKGHRYVLEAARELAALPLRIVVAGTGSREAELRELARDLPNVLFTGFLSDIAELENVMDLQLNASYGTETSSLSLLEGMSLGVPAVVSDFGGNPCLITDGENGLVVPKRDARALAEAVRRVYGDRALYGEMSRRARETYEARFTARILAENIENVYRSVCNEKKG